MAQNHGNEERLALIDNKPVSAQTSDWLGRVDGIAPVIEKWREEGERQRFSPVPVFEALRDAGFPRMLVSRHLGGSQVTLETGSQALQALSRVDPAVAWQMGVQAAIGRLSDYLPESAARELFRDQDALVVGSVNPTGVAEAVDGGYRLSGRWGFASGSAHAAWLVCAARITVDGTPRHTEHGPEIRMLFVPKQAVRMLDNWRTLGLRGTGSEDYEVDDVFVADAYTVAQRDMFFAPPARPSRGYAISYYDFGLFGSSSTVLGAARGALQEFQRLAAATVAEQCCAAIDSLFTVAGTSSLYASSMLERYFRDAHSAAKHITLSPTNVEMAGQYLLGGGLSMRR